MGSSFFEITPDLGFLNFTDHFDPAANSLLVQIDESELTPVGGSYTYQLESRRNAIRTLCLFGDVEARARAADDPTRR